MSTPFLLFTSKSPFLPNDALMMAAACFAASVATANTSFKSSLRSPSPASDAILLPTRLLPLMHCRWLALQAFTARCAWLRRSDSELAVGKHAAL